MKFNSNPSTGGSQNFLKIKGGETVQLVVHGDPYEFYVKWQDKKSVHVPDSTPGGSFRFRINVIINEKTGMVAKIWEQGPTVYNLLKELHEEYDLTKTALKVKREGEGMDTAYTLLPVRQELNAQTIAKIEAVQLNDLAEDHKKAKENGPSSEAAPPFDSSEEIPF